MLGDNRTNSTDSRRFGLVTMDRIIGKVFFTNWPLDDIGPVSQADYPDEG
ncbi:MAG: S26 family signal peptidase [Chloroflexota bacterium]|nr:S26 family signal peptidase [Chloroflexota bacterium]